MFKTYLQSHRGIVFNAMFVLYVLTLQPIFLQVLNRVVREEQGNVWISLFLLAIIFAELFALRYKLPAIFSRLTAPPGKGYNAFWSYGWVLHTVVTVMLGIELLVAFGVDIHEPGAAVLVLPLLVIKEIYVLTLLSDTKRRPRAPSFRKEWAADIALFVFTAVAYTATWELTALDEVLIPTRPVILFVLTLLAAALIFIFFYAGARLSFLVEEYLTIKSRREWMEWAISWIIVMAFALAPLVI